MVAEPVTLTKETPNPEQSRNGQAKGAKARKSRLLDIVEAQDEMMFLVRNRRQKPLVRIQAARVMRELEAQRRAMLGHANPAPVKVEPKKARSRSPAAPVDS